MKKISIRIDLYKLVLLVYFLLEARFFYLISVGGLDNFISYKNKFFIVLYVVFIFIFFVLLRKKVNFNQISAWSLLFLVYVILETIKNSFKYNLDFYRAFYGCQEYFFLLLFPVLACYSDKERMYKYIINIITFFSIILSSLFLLQAFLFNRFNISFLYISEYQSLSIMEIRNYGIRLTAPGTIIIFSTLISFGQILGKNKTRINFINIILGLLYIIFVCQTRMTTWCVFGVMFLILFFKLTKNRYKLLKGFIIFLITIAVLIVPYKITDLTGTERTGSVYARVYAVELYTNYFIENPIFGIGPIPDDNKDAVTTEVLRGSKGYAHITDVGYISYVLFFGIVGIVFLVFLVKILYNIIKKNKIKDGAYYSLLMCLIYILLTSSTLSIFNTQRIVILPFILYIAYYISKRSDDDSKGILNSNEVCKKND